MSKLAAAAIVCVLVVTACGGGNSSTATAAILGIGSVAHAPDGSTVKLYAVDRPASNVYENPLLPLAKNTEWLTVDVEECAGKDVPADAPLMPYDGDFELVMADNTHINRDLQASRSPSYGATLAAGECTRGWVTFNVPVGARLKSLVLDTNYSTPRAWHATFALSP